MAYPRTIIALTFWATLVGASPQAPRVDLRGVRLGMSAGESLAALKAAGFATTPLPFTPDWRASDARLTRWQPYQRTDMEFSSTFATTKRSVRGNWSFTDRVIVAFLPPPNRHLVWAIGQGTRYRPGTGPSARSTTAALTAKFGRPSFASPMRLAWYWDKSGRQLGSQAHASCRQAQHNTYLVNQLADSSLRGSNVVADKPDWFAAAVKEGCATSIVAEMNIGAADELSYLEIKLVDLANGYAGAQRTSALAQQRRNSEIQRDRAKADNRKPDF